MFYFFTVYILGTLGNQYVIYNYVYLWGMLKFNISAKDGFYYLL